MTFLQKLDACSEKNNSLLCVGLDPDLKKIPQHLHTKNITEVIVSFNKAIIDVTADLVCAYKPNPAFYEAEGIAGMKALYATVAYMQQKYPDIPIIYDAKRGDIGNTNKAYMYSAFDTLGVDAITMQSYLGKEAILPLLERKDKCILLLVQTSNPGAGEFQSLEVVVDGKKMPLYKKVAMNIANEWNTNDNCGVVVGATYPKELREVRKIVGDMPILIPGVGAQVGNLEATIMAGRNSKGKGMIINVSRSVLYASKGEDFAFAARKEAERLHAEIVTYL